MPMPHSFADRSAKVPAKPLADRTPIAAALAAAIIAGLVLTLTRADGLSQVVMALVAAVGVVVVVALQRRTRHKRFVPQLVLGIIAVCVSYLVVPFAFFLGPCFVSAMIALVVFLRRSDNRAAVVALALAGAGIALRWVVSAGSLPAQLVSTLIAVSALAVLVAITHKEWLTRTSPAGV